MNSLTTTMAAPKSHGRLESQLPTTHSDHSSRSTLISEKGEESAVQNLILDELRVLNALCTEQAAQPPDRHEYHRNMAINAAVALLGIVFGVFSILSWINANKANILTDMSNGIGTRATQLDLLAFCQSLRNVRVLQP